MVMIHKVKLKNDISFGNSEENNKGGNTNTALGVGLGAGLVGGFVGSKYFGKELTAEEVLSKDTFDLSNQSLTAEEQKAVNTIKEAKQDFEKKVDAEVAERFKGSSEINAGNPDKLEKRIAKDKQRLEKLAEEIKKREKTLENKTAKADYAAYSAKQSPNNNFKDIWANWSGIFRNKAQRKLDEAKENLNNFKDHVEVLEAETKLAGTDGKITKEAYKTHVTNRIKAKNLSKVEEALKVLKSKLPKASSTKNGVIAGIICAVAGFFATKMLIKPKETPIPEEAEIEVAEASIETEESEEKAA